MHTHVYMTWSCPHIHTCAHAQGCIQSHFGVTMHYSASVNILACANTHKHTLQACLCVHTTGTPTHGCSYIYLHTCMPLQSMYTLIHTYSFVPHTLSPAQACRHGEDLSEQTWEPGLESLLFPFLAVWLWVYFTSLGHESQLSEWLYSSGRQHQ